MKTLLLPCLGFALMSFTAEYCGSSKPEAYFRTPMPTDGEIIYEFPEEFAGTYWKIIREEHTVVYQISLQLKKTMLIKSPIIVSCMATFLEKHRVLRCKRLIRVRKSRFLRSICQVFSLPMNSFRAGKQRRYAPHSSQNHCFTRMPARFNKRRSFLNVSSVRGPRTKAIIWPVS